MREFLNGINGNGTRVCTWYDCCFEDLRIEYKSWCKFNYT